VSGGGRFDQPVRVGGGGRAQRGPAGQSPGGEAVAHHPDPAATGKRIQAAELRTRSAAGREVAQATVRRVTGEGIVKLSNQTRI